MPFGRTPSGKIRSFVNMTPGVGLHTPSVSAVWMKTGAGIMTGHLKHLSQAQAIKERIYHICPFNTIHYSYAPSQLCSSFQDKSTGHIYHEYTEYLSTPKTVNSIKDVFVGTVHVQYMYVYLCKIQKCIPIIHNTKVEKT